MAEDVMDDIVVTARSSAELSSSGGGWGGGWGGDAFLFNASDT